MYGIIALFDIKNSSALVKTEDKSQARQELKRIVVDSAPDEIRNNITDLIGCGDGFYLLFDTSDFEKIFAHFSNVRKIANNSKKIRIRAALHIGTFEKDNSFGKPDCIGQGMDEAARYNENDYLREALDKNEGQNFVLGISSTLYDTVKNERWFIIENYALYNFKKKDFNGTMYLDKTDIQVLPIQQIELENDTNLELTENFENFLQKSDFVSKNHAGEESDLNTFFVYPEFSIHTADSKDPKKAKAEDILNKFIEKPENLIIYGDEQSGKTGLAKIYFSELLKTGKFKPIYIQFQDDEKGFLKNKIELNLSKEYEKSNNNFERIILLDDFHKLRANTIRKMIAEIENMSNTYIIIFVDTMFSESVENENFVKSYKHYTIRPFGHVKRSELIESWIEFNSDSFSNINYTDIDELSEFVEQTLQKGLIPYVPFYILTILETYKDDKHLDPEITSKGSCYQYLVLLALKQMDLKTQSEINVIQNFFGYIAFCMFSEKNYDYDSYELEVKFNDFISKYHWEDMTFQKLEKILKKNNIFTKNTLNLYSFSGIYFYYFFVARYLSNKLTDSKYYNLVKSMVENLNIQDNGYIVIFLIHHTRSLILFDEVQLNAMLAYEKDKELHLTKDDTQDLEQTLNKIKQLTLSAVDNSKENRRKANEAADLIDEKNPEKQGSASIPQDDITSEDINNELLNLKKVLKTIEVLGQILKNHSGEIESVHLQECIEQGMKSLERTCNHLLNQFQNSKDVFVEILSAKIDEETKKGQITISQKEEIIHDYFNAICFNVMYVTVLRCGDSLGSKDLVSIFRKIYEEEKSPISFCVFVFCSLWYKKTPPVTELKEEFNKLPLAAQTIIRIMIKNYSDMHPIGYQDKGKLAAILGIKVAALKIDYSK